MVEIDSLTLDRFWSKVDKRSPEECWVWIAGKRRRGYGMFASGPSGGLSSAAHRASWQIRNGEIPHGLFVCHRCDNPTCVNPEHLFVASHDENMRDQVLKGRARRGSSHNQAKLTEDEVRAIRTSMDTASILAKRYSIHVATVRKIITRKKWAHI